MKMDGNTILITGGATGIGYAMAEYFLGRKNTVIICGRREDRLKQTAKELPGIDAVKCDVANPRDRENLLSYIKTKYPKLNILINNAGIQRDVDLTKGLDELDPGAGEIKINFEAPIYLSALFTPFLAGKENAAIINVSSGLAFMVEYSIGMPVYCATKAGIHAFSLAQRKQLERLKIKVIEIIPPMVESELNIEGRKKRNLVKTPYMVSAGEFVKKAFEKMENEEDEIRWESGSWKR